VGKRFEGKLQCVGNPEIEVAAVSDCPGQIVAKPRILLDRDHCSCRGTEGMGENATARPNLQHGLMRPRLSQGDDFPDNVRINEEMLSEARSEERRVGKECR